MSKKPIKELKVIYPRPTQESATWKDLEKEGPVVKAAGNSELYATGNWVPKKLHFLKENCINCGLCWPVCPDDAIIFDKEGNMVGVDLDHCKDCGLCIEICPSNKNPDGAKHALVFEDDYRDDF